MDLNLYDKEMIDRARHRGRAYLCLACHYQKKVRVVDEHGKMEDHILRNHIELERIPFFCNLCKFKCLRRDQLVRHISHYARHVSMAASRQIVDHSPWLIVSPNPYVISDLDMAKLSQEDSLKFFLEKKIQRQSPLIDDGIGKLQSGTLDVDLHEDTLRSGAISLPTLRTSQLPTSTMIPQAQGGQGQPLAPLAMYQKAHQPIFSATGQLQQWPATSACSAVQGQAMQTFSTLTVSPLQTITTALGIPQGGTTPNVRHQSGALLTEEIHGVTTRNDESHPVTILMMGLDCSPKGSTSLNQVSCQSSVGEYVPEGSSGATPRTCKAKQLPCPNIDNCPEVAVNPHQAGSHTELESEPNPSGHEIWIQVSRDQGSHNIAGGDSITLDEPTDIADPSEVVEDITGQLLAREEMTLNSPAVPEIEARKRRASETGKEKDLGGTDDLQEGVEQGRKRRKGAEQKEEPMIEVSLVAMNSLVSTMQSLKGQMYRNEKVNEKVEKGLTEMAVQMSKVTDALHRWKDVIDECTKEEKRREERRLEVERRREEDRRKEWEAETRRADRRREEDRKDRQELRQLLAELREGVKDKQRADTKKEIDDRRDRARQRSDTRREDKENRKDKSRKGEERDKEDKEDEEKENGKSMKSVLGKQYTENQVKDFGKRK